MLGNFKEGQIAAGPKLSPHFVYESYISAFVSDVTPQNSFSENYNLAIAGISGSGKAVLMQDVILNVLGVGGKVFVLDCGRNFEHLCKNLGGRYVEFNPSRPISINPFAILPIGDDRSSIESRRDFQDSMLVTLSTMVAPKAGTTYLQKSNLAMALKHCFDKKGAETNIDDIANWLKAQQNNVVANELGKMLFQYTREGSYGSFFNGPSQVSLDSDIIVIETDQLQKFPDLMAVVMQTMIAYINDYMAKKSPSKPSLLVPTLLVFDEIVKTLEHPLTLACALKTALVARRYKASMAVAIQSMTDFDNLGPDAASLFEAITYKLFNRESKKC